MAMKLRLALVGYGGVNQALVDLLGEKRTNLATHGIEVAVTVVADAKFGVVMNPEGIDPAQLVEMAANGCDVAALATNARVDFMPNADTDDVLRAIASPCVDVLVEATFTNPHGGEPALSHCRTALQHGKHVITVNKGPIAFAYNSLQRDAKRAGVLLKCEGTVMSGTPVLRQITTTLRGCEVMAFEGILNGTSNFVLGLVEQGYGFHDAVKEAQRMGYAEADPSADIEGHDVRLKTAILAHALWSAGVTPAQIACRGITGLTEQVIRDARKDGLAWRLIGSATRHEDGSVRATVEPRMLPLGHPLLAASGVTNAIAFDTDLLGRVTVSGPGAGRHETAFAILSDLIELGEELRIRTKAVAA